VYNVAPDGWLDAEVVRELAGPSPQIGLPQRAVGPVAWVLRRFWYSPTPRGMVPYTLYPWVITNDRLRAEGWSPANANDEAFVAGHAALLSELSPQRRQEALLVLAGVIVTAPLVGLVAWCTRMVRRTRSATHPG